MDSTLLAVTLTVALTHAMLAWAGRVSWGYWCCAVIGYPLGWAAMGAVCGR